MHDLQHRVLTDKAVFRQRRVVDPQPGALRGVRRIQQAPMCIGNGIQGGRAARRHFVGVGVFKIGGHETALSLGFSACMFLHVVQ